MRIGTQSAKGWVPIHFYGLKGNIKMTNNIPRGPEDVPLKEYVTDHPLVIVVKDIKTGKVVREETINYSDSKSRQWLGRVTLWATTNNYMVQTCAKKDYVV